MSWWGKGIGVAFGYVAGGPVGALVGGALGYSADKGWAGRGLRYTPRITPATLEALFALLGAVARADGTVSQSEVDWTEDLMVRMRLAPARRRRLRAAFNAGRESRFQADPRIADLRTALARDPRLLEQVLKTLIRLARYEGKPHRAQVQIIYRCGAHWGANRAWLAQQLAGPRTGSARLSIAESFAALGVTENASDAEIKLAYRRLMQRYHPDRLDADAPAQARSAAQQRATEVRQAWEQIRLARGLS